jgi:hypothetical protein
MRALQLLSTERHEHGCRPPQRRESRAHVRGLALVVRDAYAPRLATTSTCYLTHRTKPPGELSGTNLPALCFLSTWP